jgi:beta-N-acetylhexosaminidase
MPDLESATHYPGTVLFEATNLSVGRGTGVAFQVVGAPWLDAARVAAELTGLPGVAVSDTVIAPARPADGKYDGLILPAVRLRVTDRAVYDPVRLALHLVAAIRAHHSESLRVDTLGFDRRAGQAAVRHALERGVAPDSIGASWDPEVRRFLEMRSRYLLY